MEGYNHCRPNTIACEFSLVIAFFKKTVLRIIVHTENNRDKYATND